MAHNRRVTPAVKRDPEEPVSSAFYDEPSVIPRILTCHPTAVKPLARPPFPHDSSSNAHHLTLFAWSSLTLPNPLARCLPSITLYLSVWIVIPYASSNVFA